jgi:hypothetical protein
MNKNGMLAGGRGGAWIHSSTAPTNHQQHANGLHPL